MITFLSCGDSSVDNLKTRFAVLGIPQGFPTPAARAPGRPLVGDDAVYVERGGKTSALPDLKLRPGDPLDAPEFPTDLQGLMS